MPTSTADALVVPPEYTAQVLVPWGTPLVAGVEWDKDASNTSAEQEQQVGFNHDGIHYFPLSAGRQGNSRGVLVMNHEYTDASQIYTAAQGSTITADASGREKVAKAVAGHGVTVVEVQRTLTARGHTSRGRPTTGGSPGPLRSPSPGPSRSTTRRWVATTPLWGR